ncbi:MAG: helicase-related protein, partial [Planctomycetota bacterium]
GDDPRQRWEEAHKDKGSVIGKTLRAMHEHVFSLMLSDESLDWESRRAAFQAIRRAVLRESVLLRLLPDKKELDEAGWGELLVQSFFAPLPQQRESMADRITVFLEDLMAASGSLSDSGSARFALYDATRLRDQQFVALVSGDTDAHSRERIFSGFNTPLLPEVLICTSVGQEGIDLHRHCRHVVHFDLAWNPAVLEQRTGRADRIGSKTFRECALSAGPITSFLEIGVPYLAGTYDERMYEELWLRAQTCEVLTGGDLAADDSEGYDDYAKAEGQETGLCFVPLPDGMIDELRVSLHVWSEDESGGTNPVDGK